MPWQKIDDQFGVSKKVIRIPRSRRQQCVGLWLLGLNYAGRALTDGLLEEHELDELGARATDVAELVRVELWHDHTHGCDRCATPPSGAIVIHDFLVYNPSRARVEAQREAERVRKASQRDKRRTAGGTRSGIRGVSEHPDPDPDPINQDLMGHPDSVGGPAGEDLDPVVASVVTAVRDHGVTLHPLCVPDVLAFIDGRRASSEPPKVPARYYPQAISASWPEVEQFIYEKGLAS